MVRWFLAVALMCTAVVYKVESAEACSFPPPFELREDLSQGLAGVPISGVVPIYAGVWEEALTVTPTMTVRDPSGAEMPGTLELGASRIVWRSDAPLMPMTTYDATLVAGAFDQVDFTFTTAANNDSPTLVISGGDLHLSEFHRPDEQVCCNSGESSCGGPWEKCWTRSVTTEVVLAGAFSVPVEAARYYTFEGEAADARTVFAMAYPDGGGSFSAHFVARSDDYCLTVRARSLVGGADVVELVCQSSLALVEAGPFVPEPTDYSMCDDPPFNSETGEEVNTGGCNTGGGGRGGAPLLAIAVALGLLRRRRRVAPSCAGALQLQKQPPR